jgi:hypothetical protein
MATTTNAAGNYFEQAALEHLFGITSWFAPSTVDIALHSGDPGEDGSAGSSNELDSINDPGYARITMDHGTAGSSPDRSWTSVADGTGWALTPVDSLVFTATGNWTNAPLWVGAWDSSNLLFRIAIDDGNAVFTPLTNGQSLTLTSANLKFKLS